MSEMQIVSYVTWHRTSSLWENTKKSIHTVSYTTSLAPTSFINKCLWQARKMSGHVYVLRGSILPLFLRFFYLILELFWQCGIFLSLFYSFVPYFDWLTAGRRFSSGIPVSSTNKTGFHDITEILLKVALNAMTLPPPYFEYWYVYIYIYLCIYKITG